MLLLGLDILQNNFTSNYLGFVTSFLFSQEIFPILFRPLQALVSRHEPLVILLSMVLNIVSSTFIEFFCLFLLRIVLVEGFLAVLLQLILNYLLELAVVSLLNFELVLAFEFDFFERASVLIFFIPPVSLDVR